MRIKQGIQPFLDILNNRYILAIPTTWDGDLYNLYSLDLEQLVDFTEFYTRLVEDVQASDEISPEFLQYLKN